MTDRTNTSHDDTTGPRDMFDFLEEMGRVQRRQSYIIGSAEVVDVTIDDDERPWGCTHDSVGDDCTFCQEGA